MQPQQPAQPPEQISNPPTGGPYAPAPLPDAFSISSGTPPPAGGPQTPPTGSAAPPPTAGGPQQTRNPNSTQNTLLITELRDGMVITNDGSFRAVVACQSINFDLMSDREREAIEYSYQSFLNSLYFPIQIFIRSQRVDIAPYIEKLDKIRRSQDNMLLGVLMDDYINFIAALAEETNIMDKSFFIVVPYYPAGDISLAANSSKNLFKNLFAPTTQQNIVIDNATYSKAKDEIQNRINTVLNGLFQMGVRGVQLNTRELGELYYNVYNPDTAVREPIADFNRFTSAIVQKGQGRAPQPGLDKEETF